MYYIYRITNKVNGKTYIGQHKYRKLNDNYMGSGKRLWEAYRKYGIENFEKQILVFNILKREHAYLLEKTFIAAEREKVGIRNCYNIADGGNGGYTGLVSEETRQKLSKALKGKHRSEETKRKISESKKGQPGTWKDKHLPEETRKKISEANKGREFSEEHKRRLSEARKGKEPWNKGKQHSEEIRKKISEANKGKTAWNKGKKGFQQAWNKGKHCKLVDGKRVYY